MNIADDIDPNRIKDTGNFKIIVTGNYITLEFKGQDAFEFKPYVKLIFASNELPMSNDKSEGFIDAWLSFLCCVNLVKTDKERPDVIK